MDRLSSSASTASSVNDYSEHNMWNPLLELLFFEQMNGIVDSHLAGVDLAKIACSCHFALDLLCYKEEVLVLLIYSVTRRRCSSRHDAVLGTIANGVHYSVWHHCHSCNIDVLQSKSGFRIRLSAEQVCVCGWDMVPKFTDFRKLVLPFRTLFTAIEVVGLIEATLDGLIEVIFHAQAIVEFLVPGICLPPRARGYQLVHRPQLLPHSVKRLRLLWSGKQALSLTKCR